LRATGDIVLFSDEDIVYEDGYAKAILDEFEKYTEADMLLFNMKVGEARATYYTEQAHRIHIWNSGRYPTYSFAIRRSKLHAAHITFSLLFGGGAKYSNGEDSLFLYNCLKDANKIVGIDTVGYYYLQRESSVMHNVVDKKRLKLFEIVDCWLEENKHDKELYASVVKRDAVLSVFVMDAALKNRQENAEVIKMLRRRLLSHKNIILTNKNFSVKFKLGTLLLWLCPKLYYSINK
jgi:hypothetical protein